MRQAHSLSKLADGSQVGSVWCVGAFACVYRPQTGLAEGKLITPLLSTTEDNLLKQQSQKKLSEKVSKENAAVMMKFMRGVEGKKL